MVRSDQRTQKRSLSPVFCLSEFSGHFLWSLIFFATFPAQHWNPLEVQGRLCSPWENCSFLCNPDVWFKILLYFFIFLPSVSLGTAWHFRRIYPSLKWELNLISSWTGSIQKVLSFVCSPLQHFLHYGNHKSPAAIPGVVRSRVVCEHTEDCGITFKIIYHLIKVSRWKDTDLMLQCVMMLSVKQSTCAASDFTYARHTIWAGSCGKKSLTSANCLVNNSHDKSVYHQTLGLKKNTKKNTTLCFTFRRFNTSVDLHDILFSCLREKKKSRIFYGSVQSLFGSYRNLELNPLNWQTERSVWAKEKKSSLSLTWKVQMYLFFFDCLTYMLDHAGKVLQN